MQPSTNLRFEIAHLDINEWLLPIIDLLFDSICNPFVEIDFEHMFQRLLDNDIYKLQFIGIIGRNKHDKYVLGAILDPIKNIYIYSCVCSNTHSTIQAFELLINRVVGSTCVGRPTKPCKQNPLLCLAWTNDFH
jgi:hypothetical protein